METTNCFPYYGKNCSENNQEKNEQKVVKTAKCLYGFKVRSPSPKQRHGVVLSKSYGYFEQIINVNW